MNLTNKIAVVDNDTLSKEDYGEAGGIVHQDVSNMAAQEDTTFQDLRNSSLADADIGDRFHEEDGTSPKLFKKSFDTGVRTQTAPYCDARKHQKALLKNINNAPRSTGPAPQGPSS